MIYSNVMSKIHLEATSFHFCANDINILDNAFHICMLSTYYSMN